MQSRHVAATAGKGLTNLSHISAYNDGNAVFVKSFLEGTSYLGSSFHNISKSCCAD